MFKLLEWTVVVVLPAAGAIVMSIGLLLHWLGQLAPALRAIDPTTWRERARPR